MKFFKYIILLLFFSCSNITSGVDKVYICGDHPYMNIMFDLPEDTGLQNIAMFP